MAGSRHFVRVATGDEALERLQDNLERALERLSVLERGVTLRDVELPPGATIEIRHPLGRLPAGWSITRARGGYPQAYETARTNQSITLQSANACTVDVEVW